MAHSHDSPIWQPYTQMKTAPPPLKVVKGEGVWLELDTGERILDAISSWWVTIHGHSHPVLAEALYHQAQQLEQVIFAGFSHAPAEQLATRVLAQLPDALTRVFFSDNGSTAIEVALKMAYQYWHNLGETQRRTFITVEGAYHGDTLGAMSVGAGAAWWQPFRPLMFATEQVPFPATFEQDAAVEQREAKALEAISQLLKQQADLYVGIILEPLIQGAGGMRICRPEFLRSLQDLAQQFNLLVIYDEVMTGFGRTGDLFACRKANTVPDIICLSKGLSGGCLPLAVTIAQEKIYQAFYRESAAQALYHGHTYTGNPLACATGVASLQLLEANPNQYQRLEALHRCCMAKLVADYPLLNHRLEHIRFCGTIAAMDLKTCEASGYFNSIAPQLKAQFLAAGVLLRPLGNTLYIMPPYCITESELGLVYEAIGDVLGKSQG
jgi:adenosylmethionine---8-amino-7-oxononanoate aminotransferase